MKTIKLQQSTLPQFLPHGWKKEVAAILGVNVITIWRNLKRGRGLMYDKIVKTAATKYGEKVINN